MTNSSTKDFNFEDSLKELEEIVSKSEEGGTSLENMIRNYERGVKLLASCRGKLNEADLQIEQALKDNSKLPADHA